ncbi:DUF3859 domain-containing protein [Jannaschia rubra]|uniref:DUF3859 domain-containing protein n=1 Tax=Jannaschia rubra TaxID=282197 RepID=A0A0M6XP38_9RHOB|nr:DUF3859 domain-containing protein [Jannaschia rubra]CTQ31943.1 hypothetical protein JAN5088_00702 [Jannaschia rubra]SFG41511.1 protein of unknown function [Jannaschia rubra]
MILSRAFLSLLLLSPVPAAAQVRLVGAGIVCPRESRGELVPAPGTEAGHIRRIEEGLIFDLPDRIVPTMDDLSFGFRTALKPGTPTQTVTVVVTHPPMGPRGVEREEWTDVIEPGTQSLNLFTFEEDYEKVPGPWTFAIELDGVPLVEVPFEVTEADGRGRIEQVCFQFLS